MVKVHTVHKKWTIQSEAEKKTNHCNSQTLKALSKNTFWHGTRV